LTRLIYVATQNQTSLGEVINNVKRYPEIGSSAAKVENFAMMMEGFRGQLTTKNAFELATDVARHSGLLKALYEDKSIEGISRYENITELLNSIQEFVEDDESEDEKTLPIFLEKVALYTDEQKDNDPNRDCVSLMTIHASKGLEFPVVFIVGLEENLFPSQMALLNRSEIEEERRLFYVAITRAEQKLFLSFATSRFKHGSLLHCEPSRFLSEIDSSYLDMSLASMKQRSVIDDIDSSFGGRSYGSQSSERYVSKKEPVKGPKIFTSGSTRSTAPLPPEDPNFVAGDITGLKVGDRVQHQRFGIGNVLSIDGEGDSKKANVSFDSVGSKTLVLKFV
jgi:DNA helicase-2/ATP-dependent DNA helicase PcrA